MDTMSESFRTALRLVVDFDPELLAIVGRSLAVSITATLLGAGLGLAAGAWLGVARFPGRGRHSPALPT